MKQARGALRVATAWGYHDERDAVPIEATLDRVAAMTWRRWERCR